MQFRELPSAAGNSAQHYANMNSWHVDWNAQAMLGAFWRIDEGTFDEFLNILPPLYCGGGFRLCERLTGDIAATFLQVAGGYWCAYTDLTTIKPADMVAHISAARQEAA